MTQNKPSTKNAPLHKQLTTGGIDFENLAELIASQIIAKTTDSYSPALAPTVTFNRGVRNPDTDGISILSAWFDNEAKSLKDSPEELNDDEQKQLRLSLAIFAIVQNHDSNKGNFVKFSNHIRGIDNGHAFGNLVRGPTWIGGGMIHPDHPIFDFFNREKVCGFKTTRMLSGQIGSRSKIWKNFKSMDETLILHQDMVNQLKTVSELFKQGGNIESAKRELSDFSNVCQNYKNYLAQTLAQLVHNFEPSVVFDINDFENTLDLSLEKIQNYIEKNAKDMLLASDILQIQIDIDKALDSEADENNIKQEITNILEKYRNIPNNPGLWIKTHADFPAHQGDLLSYVMQRIQMRSQLGKTNKNHKLFLEQLIENKISTNKTYYNQLIKNYLANKGLLNFFNPINKNKITLANYLIKIINIDDDSNRDDINKIILPKGKKFKEYCEGRLGEVFSTICQDIFGGDYQAEISEKLFYDLIIKRQSKISRKKNGAERAAFTTRR